MRYEARSFQEFYPYYLTQHQNLNCRRMHFIGTLLVIADLIWALVRHNPWWLLLAPVLGYGCAWLGHGWFEKNRPATLGHPFWSLMGDGRMFWDMLWGRLRLW